METILQTVRVISHTSEVTKHRLYLDSSRFPKAVAPHDPPTPLASAKPSATFLCNTEPGSYCHPSYTADIYNTRLDPSPLIAHLARIRIMNCGKRSETDLANLKEGRKEGYFISHR